MSFELKPIRSLILPTSQVNPATIGKETFRYVDIASVDRERKRIADPKETKADAAPSRARKGLKQGDVIVSTVRPNLNAIALVTPELEGAIASTGFCVIRSDRSKVVPEYLFFATQRPEFVGSLTSQASGASYPAVSDDQVKSETVPLPRTLSEQHKIVSLLRQAYDLLQSTRSGLTSSESLLQASFRAIFGQELTFPLEPLHRHVSTIDSGSSPKCLNRPATDNEWAILKLGAVTWGNYAPDENKALPPELIAAPRDEVQQGDVLFTRKNTRELVGAAAYVFETPPRRLLPDLIFRLVIRDREELDPIYLWQLLLQPAMRTRIQSLASGAADSMPNISKARLMDVEIPVPPPELQKKFHRIALQWREVDLRLKASAAKTETLFQTLLQRAFDGRLTAKWREAHAKELLEEMQLQSRA